MKNKGENNIQKFSLRKYKGIGAASVLLGLFCIVSTPVFAQDTTTTPKETIETSNDNIKIIIKIHYMKFVFIVYFLFLV